MRTKTLWIKEEYLNHILSGHKRIEVRVGYENIANLQVGDNLLLNQKYPYTIKRIGRYADFFQMLQHEDHEAIAPGSSPEDLLERIRELYPLEKEELGVIALEITPAAAFKVHILENWESWAQQLGPGPLEIFRSLLPPHIEVTYGSDVIGIDDYHLLVGGRPQREHLAAKPNLAQLIIPWAGIPPETRDLLEEFPHISVHNLHHNAAPTAELALALLLSAAKFIISYDRSLRNHDWSPRYASPSPVMLLSGKTALILGYGAIGRRVAAGCKGLGMNIIAIRNRLTQTKDNIAAEIYTLNALNDLLPRADALIVCLPLTKETENLIDNEKIDLLPAGAVLVNIGRGPIVNENALYSALKNGRLRAAGLDVWYNYPSDELARTNTPAATMPFIELENVVMSPHRGGDTADTELLRIKELARLISQASRGQPLDNKVDLKFGY